MLTLIFHFVIAVYSVSLHLRTPTQPEANDSQLNKFSQRAAIRRDIGLSKSMKKKLVSQSSTVLSSLSQRNFVYGLEMSLTPLSHLTLLSRLFELYLDKSKQIRLWLNYTAKGL